ncbi:MAG: MGH1-like glycoside hydrolase domain-containing protein [Metamycoplasmataceae bacterium]
MKYKNILNYYSDSLAEVNFQSLPYDKENNYKDTNKSNVFADNGSWHGYYLPKNKGISSFMGPLVLSQEIPLNVGPYSNKLIIKLDNKILNFDEAKSDIFSLPGKLVLNYDFEKISINKELIFCSNRTALISTNIINKTNEELNLNLSIEGSIYLKNKTKSTGELKDDSQAWFNYFKEIKNDKNLIEINFNSIIDKKVNESLNIEYSHHIQEFTTSKKENELIFNSDFGSFKILGNKKMEISSFESFRFNNDGLNLSFNFKDKFILENENRWNKYIANILKINNDSKYETLIIKSLQTLITNWRSPAGVIKKNFVIPSITYQDFIGAWSWDTWKIVVGISYFDHNLAQECLEAMFDFQIKENDPIRPKDIGMIPDCIFFNYSPARGGVGPNWNERNTKPPIAAWAVNEIYKISKDKEFLKRIYPKIVAYNNWWNNNRSVNKDCILQYGATVDIQNKFEDEKTIIEAAAWESGMDNAPRFDWDRAKVEKVFHDNVLIGYVIDQISVDLNSFNYLDFVCLENLSKILNYENEAQKYLQYSQLVKEFINKYMYNEPTKFYYDIKSIDKRKVVDYGKGMEGMLPLFVNLAPNEKAKSIIENIHERNYNQFVPFPSVSVNNERFNELDYWRGPVWVDQLYFGLKGIMNYKYDSFAKELANKALNNMQGLMEKGPSIRENYNPLNGDGLSTTNFSWSASLILNIIKEIINK